MDAKNRYYRSFLIFEKEDGGFESGREPSGYVKIECRDGKGTLQALVQNLREAKGSLIYKLYMLAPVGGGVRSVCAGTLSLQRGKGELKWEFDEGNVALSGIPIKDFRIAAVLAEDQVNGSRALQCPLAAYKGDKIPWRESTERLIHPPMVRNEEQEQEQEQEVFQRKDEFTRYLETLENNPPAFQMPMPELEAPPGEVPAEEQRTDEEEAKASDEEYSTVKQNPPKAYPEFQSAEDILAGQESRKSQISQEGQNPKCGSYQACMNCFAMRGQTQPPPVSQTVQNSQPPQNGRKPIGDRMERLKKSFDQYFTVFDPFGSRRRDYKWWKVNSPVYLNNLLYQCDIRTPLLFNPNVMMAHFKFRHLAAGIFSDRFRRREFIVCGIPGVFGVDVKPFGEMCKWVQIEGNIPKYGAFGYWLVYIDPNTGKFLNIS